MMVGGFATIDYSKTTLANDFKYGVFENDWVMENFVKSSKGHYDKPVYVTGIASLPLFEGQFFGGYEISGYVQPHVVTDENGKTIRVFFELDGITFVYDVATNSTNIYDRRYPALLPEGAGGACNNLVKGTANVLSVMENNPELFAEMEATFNQVWNSRRLFATIGTSDGKLNSAHVEFNMGSQGGDVETLFGYYDKIDAQTNTVIHVYVNFEHINSPELGPEVYAITFLYE